LLVETNIPRHLIKQCLVYCEKETNNKRTKVFTIPNSIGSASGSDTENDSTDKKKVADVSLNKHFEYYKGSWKYTYRCQSGFPVKSGITHSPLRFIAEVLIQKEGEEDRVMTFISDEQFYMYSKIPENVKLKKQQQQGGQAPQRRNSDEDLTPKDTPPTPFRSEESQPATNSTTTSSVNSPIDFMLSQQQERLENVEKSLQGLQSRSDNQTLQRLIESIQQIGNKQETQFQAQMKLVRELQAGQDDIRRHIRGSTLSNLFADSSDLDRFALSTFEFMVAESERDTKRRKMDGENYSTTLDVQVCLIQDQNCTILREESYSSGIVEANIGDVVSLRLSHTRGETMYYFILWCDLIHSRVETLSAESSRMEQVEEKSIDCGTKTLHSLDPNTTVIHNKPLTIEERFISTEQGRGMIRFKVLAIPQSRLQHFLDTRGREDQDTTNDWAIANRVILVTQRLKNS
jgi:hypothetical protein